MNLEMNKLISVSPNLSPNNLLSHFDFFNSLKTIFFNDLAIINPIIKIPNADSNTAILPSKPIIEKIL